MAWDSKMPPFDLSELEQNTTHPSAGIGTVVGGAGGVLGQQMSNLDCSVDLKLGGFGELGSSDSWKDQPRPRPPAAASSSSPGPSKRARAQGGGNQIASCLVEGCKADLSKCRDYHRRHKVCEEHSKTRVVIVGGQQQRFCQQCSRFHLLGEFDEVKRSCRKRLDGHNRRRRKVQLDPINTGNLFTNHQVSRFSSYPQIFPTATQEPSWSGIIKNEEDLYTHHQQPFHFLEGQHQPHFPVPLSNSFKEGKQFPFLQDSCNTSLLRTFPASVKMFPEGIPQQAVLNSDCALSLLSSPAQTAPINLGQMVEPERIPMGQPLVSNLEYNNSLSRYSRPQATSTVSPTAFSCSGIDDAHVGTAILVPGATDADLHCQGLFQVGGEGSSDAASQIIHFSWQ